MTQKTKYAHFDKDGKMIATTNSDTVNYSSVQHSKSLTNDLLDEHGNLRFATVKLNLATEEMEGITQGQLDQQATSLLDKVTNIFKTDEPTS